MTTPWKASLLFCSLQNTQNICSFILESFRAFTKLLSFYENYKSTQLQLAACCSQKTQACNIVAMTYWGFSWFIFRRGVTARGLMFCVENLLLTSWSPWVSKIFTSSTIVLFSYTPCHLQVEVHSLISISFSMKYSSNSFSTVRTSS